MRTRKAIYNSISKLTYEVIVAISALILPRLILTRFGSDYNGVTASITQFISYVSLLTAGVSGVTQAALYKPLAEQNTMKISGIVRATELFMRKIALIFAVGLLGFAVIYPLLVQDEFEWFFTFTLVLILGGGTFARYFFGITYQTLLTADQRGYVTVIIGISTTILNTVIAVALILIGCEIRIVKLASALVYLLNPICTYIYVGKRYAIIKSISPDNSAIKQRWDAFAHQVANFVNKNTDIVILTLFTSVWEVSVYVVYHVVINNIRTIIVALTGSGVVAAFGDMLAKNEHKSARKSLQLYEYLTYALSVLFFSSTALLIIPFVSVYTKGVLDVDYHRPVFAYLSCFTQYFNVIRIPYESVAHAAGHFRQTRNGAIAEAVINIVLSLVLVQKFGLVGVTIGTLCAMVFRTVQYAVYMSRHIVERSLWVVVRNMLISLLNAAAIVAVAQLIPNMVSISYLSWSLYAMQVFGVSVIITAFFSCLFYRAEARELIVKLLNTLRPSKHT